MIHYRLLLIENQDAIRAIKLKRQEEFVKEFSIEFAKWVECSKTYYTPMEDLLKFYLNELHEKYAKEENFLIFDSKINK
jgi:hypothetical protein